MTWHLLSANWSHLKTRLSTRFPHLDFKAFTEPPRDRRALVQHLAETHHLTFFEAYEELEDFLNVEDLARQVMDFRAP